MTETGENSGDPDGADDPCEKLRQKIDELINRNKHEFGGGGTHGLVHRFRELISSMTRHVYGKSVTPEVQAGWIRHIEKIEEYQTSLTRALENFRKNGCGDPPPGAWSWAEREVPDPKKLADEAGIPWGDVFAAGASAGLAAAVLYGAYRVIRFLPSLYPPLWSTIPANLAIP